MIPQPIELDEGLRMTKENRRRPAGPAIGDPDEAPYDRE
jgi:hypothetical protein